MRCVFSSTIFAYSTQSKGCYNCKYNRQMFEFIYCMFSVLTVQRWAKKWTCFAKQQPGMARQKMFAT